MLAKRLLLLNGVAIILAVSHHAIWYTMNAAVWWADRVRPVAVPNLGFFGSPSYYGLMLLDIICVLAVPAFLVVTGYFLAFVAGKPGPRPAGAAPGLTWGLVARRIWWLLIPYLLWSLAIVALRMLEGERFSPGQLSKVLLTGGAIGGYYYVPMLIQFYVIAPLWAPLVRRAPMVALAGAILALLPSMLAGYLLMLSPSVRETPAGRLLFAAGNWAVLQNLLWLTLGMVVGFYPRRAATFAGRLRPALPLLLVVTFGLTVAEAEFFRRGGTRQWVAPQSTLAFQLFAVAALLAFLTFSESLQKQPARLVALGTMSYGIYLAHVPVQYYTGRLIYHFATPLLAYPVLLYLPALLIAGIAVPVALIKLMEHSPAARYRRYLFG